LPGSRLRFRSGMTPTGTATLKVSVGPAWSDLGLECQDIVGVDHEEPKLSRHRLRRLPHLTSHLRLGVRRRLSANQPIHPSRKPDFGGAAAQRLARSGAIIQRWRPDLKVSAHARLTDRRLGRSARAE
jgi:hypothetical protein